VIIVVLFVSGLAVAAFALLQARRGKVKVAAAPPSKDKPPPGLDFKDPAGFKEPAGHGPDTVLEA